MIKKVIIALPHLKCGGTERTAAEIANYLARNGIEVTLLLMYRLGKFYTVNPEVRIIEPSFNARNIGKYIFIPRLLIFLRRHIKKQDPDVILALGYITLTLYASLRLNAKVVISYRSSPERIRYPNNWFLNKAYLLSHILVSRRVNGVIAQTYYAEEIYTKRYNCPIVVIPNFLRDLTAYQHERENQIITVGHCSFEKGQHYLLNAFSKLDACGWKLVIVGDGPKRKELEQLAITLKIHNRVVFTGYRNDVDFFLSQSKIFALTSVIEGYPNALIEAMATPLPPVSFDCIAGPSDIIRDGENGFLVRVGDVDSLSQKIQKLIDDPVLRDRIEGKAYMVRQSNKLENTAEKYLKFLESVIR